MLVSPCDAIVGASGTVDGDVVIQAKGLSYTLHDLLDDPVLERLYRNGRYVTLRLTSSMYHRFHAPHDCRVVHLNYFSGDTWNTNPIAVGRVEKLYCKNEHAVIQTRPRRGRSRRHLGAGGFDPGGQHPAAFPLGLARHGEGDLGPHGDEVCAE